MDRLAKRLMKIAEEIEVEAAPGRFDDMNPMTKPCPKCPGTMNYDFNNKSYRCTRCHHYERVQPRYFQGGEKRASLMRWAGYVNARYGQAQDADEQRQIDVGQIPQKMKKVYGELGNLIEKGDELTAGFKKGSGVFDRIVQNTGLNSLGSWTATWKKMAPVLVDAHDVAAAISAPDSVDDMVQLQYYVNSAFRRDYQLKDLEGALRNAWKGFHGELPEHGGYKEFIDGIWQVARDFDAVIKLILG